MTLRGLSHTVARLFTRGVVAASDDADGMQRVTPRAYGEDGQPTEHPQEYGLSSRAPDGAEVFVALVDGEAGAEVVVTVADRRYRVKGLERGEVCLHDDQGQAVKIARDGIEVAPKSGAWVKVLGSDVRIGTDADAAIVRWPELKAILSDFMELATGGLMAGANPVTANPAKVAEWLQLTVDVQTNKPAATTAKVK